jgi:hypothetical protein
VGVIRKLILVATAIAMLGFSGSAGAATVTYTSSEVPRSMLEGGIVGSNITIPRGRTRVTDVDVVGIQLLASNSGDQTLELNNPAGFDRLIANNCTSYPAGTNFTLDQEAAGNPFGPGTCPPGTGTYKPSTSPESSTPLADFAGSPAGTFSLIYDDAGGGGTGGTLNGWGLRITHEPLGCILRAEDGDEQKLKKAFGISALCNADSSLTTSGHARRLTFPLTRLKAQLLSVPLKKKAFKRLRKKGKAKIGLTVDDGYGDILSQTMKIKIKRKKLPSS